MRRSHLSSNSDSQDQNLQFNFKQVHYNGQISNSQHQDSQMQESISNYDKNIQKLGSKEKNGSSEPLQKSKMIKKNCQSAKASRQRKKIYLDELQHTASKLKDQIKVRKNRIQTTFDQIIVKFSTMNKEKQKYLIQKILLSKKILKMSQQLEMLKKVSVKNKELSNIEVEAPQIQKNISPETLSIQKANSFSVEQNTKGKLKKKKCSEQRLQTGNNLIQDKISQKESILDLGINAYLYEFGSQGCYRMEVIERSKYQWISCLSNLTLNQTQALQVGIAKMKEHLQSLSKKIKKIEFYMRELKNSVKQKYVVQFLLDKQFFINTPQYSMKGSKVMDNQINDE